MLHTRIDAGGDGEEWGLAHREGGAAHVRRGGDRGEAEQAIELGRGADAVAPQREARGEVAEELAGDAAEGPLLLGLAFNVDGDLVLDLLRPEALGPLLGRLHLELLRRAPLPQGLLAHGELERLRRLQLGRPEAYGLVAQLCLPVPLDALELGHRGLDLLVGGVVLLVGARFGHDAALLARERPVKALAEVRERGGEVGETLAVRERLRQARRRLLELAQLRLELLHRAIEHLEALKHLDEAAQLGLADVLVVRRAVLGLLAREAVHARQQPLEVRQLLEHRPQHLAQLAVLHDGRDGLLPRFYVLDTPWRRAEPLAQQPRAEGRAGLVEDLEERARRAAVEGVLEDLEVVEGLGVKHHVPVGGEAADLVRLGLGLGLGSGSGSWLMLRGGGEGEAADLVGRLPLGHRAERHELLVEQQPLQVAHARAVGSEGERRLHRRGLAQRRRPRRLSPLEVVLLAQLARGVVGAPELRRVGDGAEQVLLHGASEQQVRLAAAAALVEDDLARPQLREQCAQAVLLRVVGALAEREVARGRVDEAHAEQPALRVLGDGEQVGRLRLLALGVGAECAHLPQAVGSQESGVGSKEE